MIQWSSSLTIDVQFIQDVADGMNGVRRRSGVAWIFFWPLRLRHTEGHPKLWLVMVMVVMITVGRTIMQHHVLFCTGTVMYIYIYYITISYHILPYIIIYYHILSYIIIYYHILSYIIIYYHILSYIIIYYIHTLSWYIIICYHLSSYIIIYYHLLSYIFIYYHICIILYHKLLFVFFNIHIQYSIHYNI